MRKKRMNQNKTRVKGFSLVELMIYVGLVSLVLLLVSSLSISIARLRDQAYAMGEISYYGRTAIGIASEKIREAVRVDFPSAGEASSTLLFAADDSALPDRISLINNSVYLITASGETKKITGDQVIVTSLSFLNTSLNSLNTNIGITLEIKASSSGQEAEYSQKYVTSVSTRR
jgi:type II secretory pathway pseudopilin PulG